LENAFRKLTRVGSLTGGTKWYLSDDCLLAAKRVMYSIEYRRFYLHDLESIVVWPNNTWVWRPIVLGLLFALLGYAFWQWINLTTGAIFGIIGLAWVALELALGPRAKSRICTSGASVDLPVVQRTRRAHKVLAKIDAAVRAARGATAQPSAPQISPELAEPSVQPTSGDSAAPSIVDATQTNES
jgi:hypothetical protein